MNTVGILQGRLTLSATGELQCFPSKNWEEEFGLAARCGLDAIELLFEKERNNLNPLWSDEGIQRLCKLSATHGVAMATISADYFMTHPLTVLKDSETFRVFKWLLEQALKLQIPVIVIPFFEKAEIKTQDDVESLVDNFKAMTPILKKSGIKIALETTLRGKKLVRFVDRLDKSVYGVCYDTGNTTALGHETHQDIRLLDQRIIHIHIKDRKRNAGPNVLLGSGDTNFPEISTALKAIRYKGPFILETVRGDDPVQTAINHVQFIKKNLLQVVGKPL